MCNDVGAPCDAFRYAHTTNSSAPGLWSQYRSSSAVPSLRPPALLARRAAAPQPWLRRRAGSRMQSRQQCCRSCWPPHRWWTSPPPSLRYASPLTGRTPGASPGEGAEQAGSTPESFPTGLRLQEPLTSIPSLARVLATPTPCGRTACTSLRLRCHCLARPHGCARFSALVLGLMPSSIAGCYPGPDRGCGEGGRGAPQVLHHRRVPVRDHGPEHEEDGQADWCVTPSFACVNRQKRPPVDGLSHPHVPTDAHERTRRPTCTVCARSDGTRQEGGAGRGRTQGGPGGSSCDSSQACCAQARGGGG